MENEGRSLLQEIGGKLFHLIHTRSQQGLDVLNLIDLNDPEKIFLSLNIEKQPLSRNTHFVLKQYDDSLITKYVYRILTQFLSEGRVSSISEFAHELPTKDDLLFSCEIPIQNWAAHPLGILILSNNNELYLNKKKLSISDFEDLQVAPNGIYFSRTVQNQKSGKPQFEVSILTIDGIEETVFIGECDQWKPHPKGIAVRRDDKIYLNGDSLIYSHPDIKNFEWVCADNGRIITSVATEDPLGHRGYFLLEAGRELFSFIYEIPTKDPNEFIPISRWKSPGNGICVQSLPDTAKLSWSMGLCSKYICSNPP